MRIACVGAEWIVAIGGLAFGACGDSHSGAPATSGVSDSSGGADTSGLSDSARETEASECPPCVSDADCAGATCVQVGGDSYCAPACSTTGACDAGRSCAVVTTVAAEQASVCLPPTGACAAPADENVNPTGETCGTLVGPDVAAGCRSCGSGGNCQTNGCYGGWWCDTAGNRCHSPPSACGATGGVVYDGGAAVTGAIDKDGGTVSRLYFAIVGDTRPPIVDDTAGYPNDVIGKIYEDIQALTPRPTFAISTGDYVFAKPTGTAAAAQLDLYLAARMKYVGVLFPALGNHECTGYTRSNCGAGNSDGSPYNYQSFMTKLLAPIGRSDPYYAVAVSASDASWTAKFVVVAANAWSSAQAEWLETELAKPTTYTFVVRHEPKSADTAPGVLPSEAIMARHPLTLAITGHSHTYSHYRGSREIIVGNGGAPSTGGKGFGFALVSQDSDLSLRVDMIDLSSGKADPSFAFRLKPDGTSAP